MRTQYILQRTARNIHLEKCIISCDIKEGVEKHLSIIYQYYILMVDAKMSLKTCCHALHRKLFVWL